MITIQRIHRNANSGFVLRFAKHPNTMPYPKDMVCPDIRRAVLLIKHYYGIQHPKRLCAFCQEKTREAKVILARPPNLDPQGER